MTTTSTSANTLRVEAWDTADLEQPWRWHKPRRIVITDDLFRDDMPDEHAWAVFNVMEQADRHTFYVLTSHYARMARFVQRRMGERRVYAAKFDHCPTEAMRNSPAAQMARTRAVTPPSNIHLHAAVYYDEHTGDVLPAPATAGAR